MITSCITCIPIRVVWATSGLYAIGLLEEAGDSKKRLRVIVLELTISFLLPGQGPRIEVGNLPGNGSFACFGPKLP